MSKMSKRNRRLFITIMITALLQQAQFALTPGIAKIQSEVFPQMSLSTIQTVMMLPSLISIGFSLLSAYAISKRWISKKTSVVVGISLLAFTGLISAFLHTQYWHLILFSVLIGTGMGLYISTSASIIFDNFNEKERRMSVGVQTSVLNFGGILLSAVGGYLASLVWYGGYVMLLVAAPVIIICIRTIPNDKKVLDAVPAHVKKPANTKLPLDIFYYGFAASVFLLVFTVCTTNISNHLKAAELGNTATAGISIAVQMAGGVLSGLLFSKLSHRLKDYMMPLAFLIVFAGYMIISLGHASLALNMVGVFIVGASISVMIPQCLFSVSNRVDASNSATATAIVNCICPGIGSFLSPVIFTNLTMSIGGESTVFRFKFVAVFALVIAVVLLFATQYRSRRKSVKAAAVQPTD